MVLVLSSFLVAVAVGHVLPAARKWAPWLEGYVLWVALPAVTIRAIPELHLGVGTMAAPLVAWVGIACGMAVVTWYCRRVPVSRGTKGTMLLTASLGNTAFLGFPLVEAVRGHGALGTAVVYDQIGSFLGLAIVGSMVTATFGSGPDASAREILRRIVTFPPFIGVCIGVVLRIVGEGVPGSEVLRILGVPMGACALACIGLRLQLQWPIRQRREALVVLGWKMLLFPSVVWMVVRWADLDGTILLQAAMPPMAMSGVLAARHDLDVELASFVVGVGLLCSVVMIPLWNLTLG